MKNKIIDFLSHIIRKLPIIFLCSIIIFSLVMIVGNFSILNSISFFLCVIIPLIIIPFVLKKNQLTLWLFLAYIVLVVGNLIFFLVWGEGTFEDRVWNNVVLSIGPIGLALLFFFSPRIIKSNNTIIFAIITLILMSASNVFYYLVSAHYIPLY